MVTVSPSLVGNNNISDCHRFCSLVLERSATTQCKFSFPDGNRLSLVVLDDEGRSLAWTCQYICTPILQTHHICIPDIRMHTILAMEFSHEYFSSFLQLSCHSSSLFAPFLLSLHSFPISLYLYYFFSSSLFTLFPSVCPLFPPQ